MTDSPDRQAERGILSLLITEPGSVNEIMRQRLRSNDFIDLRHRSIWLAVVALYEKIERIDVISVIEEIHFAQHIEPVPAKYIHGLAAACLLYRRRDIVSMAQSLLPAAVRAKRAPATADELLDEVLGERDDQEEGTT